MNISIHQDIKKRVPDFKIGILTYKDIVVDESPKMLKGRLEFFQEKIQVDLENDSVTRYQGVKEWRKVFKTLGIDPGRYRPSHEALFRKVGRKQKMGFINSAVDLNNFFSLQYEIPFGIYNLDQLQDSIILRLGNEGESYKGLNGRENSLQGRLVSADAQGPFGSPIVDSARTKVDNTTANALHIAYLRPSMASAEANEMLSSLAKMFTQLHSGDAEWFLLE
ncbi:B3/4 domain-containing protein [Thalassorhabdus alkalitolerans]|uniref:B3/4 domain-containing protein n=1 Tax=Thalassorhabdus alkalitolerans TaxID=2282697 RepID=A0ABW0YMP8_9BACI|nr:phenylalanine--tRNA ligase beta subunit-related protein [Bacillus sp. FJAT-44742]